MEAREKWSASLFAWVYIFQHGWEIVLMHQTKSVFSVKQHVPTAVFFIDLFVGELCLMDSFGVIVCLFVLSRWRRSWVTTTPSLRRWLVTPTLRTTPWSCSSTPTTRIDQADSTSREHLGFDEWYHGLLSFFLLSYSYLLSPFAPSFSSLPPNSWQNLTRPQPLRW